MFSDRLLGTLKPDSFVKGKLAWFLLLRRAGGQVRESG